MNINRKRAVIDKYADDSKQEVMEYFEENPEGHVKFVLVALCSSMAIQHYHSIQVMIQQPTDPFDVLDVTLG